MKAFARVYFRGKIVDYFQSYDRFFANLKELESIADKSCFIRKKLFSDYHLFTSKRNRGNFFDPTKLMIFFYIYKNHKNI